MHALHNMNKLNTEGSDWSSSWTLVALAAQYSCWFGSCMAPWTYACIYVCMYSWIQYAPNDTFYDTLLDVLKHTCASKRIRCRILERRLLTSWFSSGKIIKIKGNCGRTRACTYKCRHASTYTFTYIHTILCIYKHLQTFLQVAVCHAHRDQVSKRQLKIQFGCLTDDHR